MVSLLATYEVQAKFNDIVVFNGRGAENGALLHMSAFIRMIKKEQKFV
jgi:hypothetical protein